MIIEIASFRVDIDERLYQDSEVLHTVVEKFSSPSSQKADFHIHLHDDRLKYARLISRAGQCNGVRFLATSDHETIFWISNWASLFDWKNKTVNFFADASSFIYDSFVLRNLKLLFMFLANKTGRLMMHASGIRKDDTFLVFSGRSGIGKSTTAKRFCARGWQLLNDECIIVEKRQNDLAAHSTPFCRLELMDTCSQSSGRIEALFFLKQSTRHSLLEMDNAKRIRSLARNSFILPFDEKTCMRHMDICHNVAGSSPIYELETADEDSVTEFVTSAIRKGTV